MSQHTSLIPSVDNSAASTGHVQRACDCGSCAACEADDKLGVQTKLTIGAPGDAYEQEADRVADQVVAGGAMPGQPIAATPLVQRMGAEVEEEEPVQMKREIVQRMGDADEEEETVQMKGNSGLSGTTGAAVAANAVASGGRPLSATDRAYFEPRFGHDLSSVRLHTDGAAQQAARAINARAYTLRNHIAFAPGEHNPGSLEGRRLLAHELTHTLQQGGAIQRKPAKARSRKVLAQMVERPEFAHRVWENTSEPDQRFVLTEMEKRYGASNPAWVDEFLTLQGNGYRGAEMVVDYKQPATETAEDMIARGFGLYSSGQSLGLSTEIWISPAGKQVFLVRDIKPNTQEQDAPTETPEADEAQDAEERVADFAQSEIEDLLGVEIPGFSMASLVSEDEDGNRTIAIAQVFGANSVSKTIECSADDTCTFGGGEIDEWVFRSPFFIPE